MATTYSAVNGNAITITTDEIELAKRGGVVVATDGKTHELVVTITTAASGWVNVNVAESASWSRPLDFGFLPAGEKSRWSYNKRPNQIIVEAMKKVRTAQARAPKLDRRERELRQAVQLGGDRVGDQGFWLAGQFVEVE